MYTRRRTMGEKGEQNDDLTIQTYEKVNSKIASFSVYLCKNIDIKKP